MIPNQLWTFSRLEGVRRELGWLSEFIIFAITQACSPECSHDFILMQLFVLGESPAQPGQSGRVGRQGRADGKIKYSKVHEDMTMALI